MTELAGTLRNSPVELEKNMMKGQKNCKPINFFVLVLFMDWKYVVENPQKSLQGKLVKIAFKSKMAAENLKLTILSNLSSDFHHFNAKPH